MLTINYLIALKMPIGQVLTKKDKEAILKENQGKEYSYLCLMKEMFSYDHITVNDLLKGWSGIKLVNV